MHERTLEPLGLLGGLALEAAEHAGLTQRPRQSVLVAELGERLDQLDARRPRGAEIGIGGVPGRSPDEPESRVRGQAPLTEDGRALEELLADRAPRERIPALAERVDVRDHQLEPFEAVGREEARGAAEEVGRGPGIAARPRAPTGGAEVAAG